MPDGTYTLRDLVELDIIVDGDFGDHRFSTNVYKGLLDFNERDATLAYQFGSVAFCLKMEQDLLRAVTTIAWMLKLALMTTILTT